MPSDRIEPQFDTDSRTNAALIRILEADPDNWREDDTGRYYVGPRLANDGTIDWNGDGWPE